MTLYQSTIRLISQQSCKPAVSGGTADMLAGNNNNCNNASISTAQNTICVQCAQSKSNKNFSLLAKTQMLSST